jgi:hypothetical protein
MVMINLNHSRVDCDLFKITTLKRKVEPRKSVNGEREQAHSKYLALL